MEHIDLNMPSTPLKLMFIVRESLGKPSIPEIDFPSCFFFNPTTEQYLLFMPPAGFLDLCRISQSLPKLSSARKITTWCLKRYAECGDHTTHKDNKGI